MLMLDASIATLIAVAIVFVISYRKRLTRRERELLRAETRARHEREWNEKIGNAVRP